MTWKHGLWAAATCLAVSCLAAAADPADPGVVTVSDENVVAASAQSSSSWFQPTWYDSIGYRQPQPRRDVVARFGWWGTSVEGSPGKIGEWQDLESSPFWDIDGLLSNGRSTIDFSANGLDQEAHDVDFRFFHPGLSGSVEYDRFLRRRDHVPLDNFGALGDDLPVVAEDLHVGENYAVRVQELDAHFKGRITNNVRWWLNLWGMRKHGERQVNAPAHCQDIDPGGGVDLKCHLLSQRQRIDWLTMEIEPVVEGNWGPVTVEYSRPMRAFEENDEFITRSYNHFGVYDQFGGAFGNLPVGVALVPDNFTQIDRLKLGWELPGTTRAYALLWNGDTENRRRDMHRHFYGYDVRLSTGSRRTLMVSAYIKQKVELNQTPPYFLADQGEPIVDPAAIGVTEDELLGGVRFSDIRHPVDYHRGSGGFDLRWNPFRGYGWWDAWALTGGYEYFEIQRSYVTYVIGDSDFPTRTDLATRLADGDSRIFQLPHTRGHIFKIGSQRRWSPALDTYVRYNMRYTRDPLMGLRLSDEHYVETGETDFMTNTNQPEHEDLIQLGFTWTPVNYFLLTGWVGLENRATSSRFAYFEEQSYPLVLSAWYAPTPRWSISGGFGYYTNWLDQDINIGFRDPAGPRFGAFSDTWGYVGRAQVYNIGASYACTPNVTLKGDVEWVRGRNTLLITSPAGTDLSQISSFSAVLDETTRLSAGVDWQATQCIGTYFRYIYYDYADTYRAFNSGTSHMFLGGASAVF